MKRKIIERPQSPRQRMINLMYIVLLAMLAMNVSTDVLNGFSLVEDSLQKSAENATKQNNAVYKNFERSYNNNQEKVGEWYKKALVVKEMSDNLYNFADSLKMLIAIEADGKNADLDHLKNRDDLEAATQVMLNPKRGLGRKLFENIVYYRMEILNIVSDTLQREIIRNNFSTDVPVSAGSLGKNWQEYNFENTPVAAAITILTKLQNDVRYAEGQVLHTLVENVDASDLRVNALKAYVIPTTQNVVKGNSFSGQIIMAAVDTTARPVIYIEGKKITSPDGYFEIPTKSTGDFKLSGYMELNQDGRILKRDFEQKYSVVPPSATVSATMMNVLYAGYQNPVSISVPGVPANKISVSVKSGSAKLSSKGTDYVIVPSKVGQDVVIAVGAKQQDGKIQSMGDYTFRVRQLPDPTPFIEYTDANGTQQRYRGGGQPLPKRFLMSAPGIVAAIDDGLLNIGFKVISFETTFFDNLGNAVSELSDGDQFSKRQIDRFNRLTRGKRFYIQRVKAQGPDGIERQLTTSLEVIVQ